MVDSWQRQINYLRISVTDRCNFNCIYCTDGLAPSAINSDNLCYEEIARVVGVAADMGITKVRLTGGEPLLRPDLSRLVGMLAQVKGIDDISLTTNGMLLSRYATELKRAGLKRVNVSLDTLQAERFGRITGHDRLKEVLDGIEAARRIGLNPVKINMVVLKGINDDEVIDFARLTIAQGWHVRFIEYMPVGVRGEGDDSVVVSAAQIFESISVLGTLEPDEGEDGNGPARYYRFTGAEGTIGFISAMTEHFCRTCNRLRLTADGQLRPCLLDDDEVDIKTVLRNGGGLKELEGLIRRAVAIKQEQHHLAEGIGPGKRSMRQIGG
ncbi:MAG: GTP 3',8-cyclase MoaA [Chloroflexi bacterium]|nr:GTP 3',8-cyclase MoaA [Chloroflexota bacterium]